ncbi:hypothetical protein F4781DRAFT_422847 [Annulohypoxylon bovei var. microspora]|nr:hypothetical protein F4781DRAFT_422847 [Annulohypoxylon bovei var. microspora]
MAPSHASDFQFITSINTVARDDETRRKVRSHARRQKLPNGPSQPPSQGKQSGSQKDHTSKFRLKPSSSSAGGGAVSKQERKHKKTNWLAVSVARELPNFSLLHIEKTPLTENLLKYCMAVCLSPQEDAVERWFDRIGAPTYLNTYYSGFLANAFAMNPEGTWVQALQLDKAATHAFIAMIAAMHNSLAMWADTSTIDFHRFQAVKSINERLNLEGKDDSKPISDGLVVAVALLVNIEAFIGSLAAAAAHMSGLKRMVDLRGGIVEGFQHSTILQRSISWADYSYATAAHKPVVFPFIPQLASSLALHDRFTSRSMLANMEPLGFKDLTIQNREAVELFELLYSITECINDFDYASLESTYGQRVQVSDSIYMVEWRLCHMEELSRSHHSWKRAGSVPLPSSGEEADRHPRYPSPTDLSDVLMYAAHLFLHLAIRGQPPSAQRHRALGEALMSALCDPILTLDLLSQPKNYGETPASQIGRNSPVQPPPGSISTYAPPSELSQAQASIPIPIPRQPKDELHADILLWSLFIGSCIRIPVSLDSTVLQGDQHEFFVNALRNYCRTRGISSRDVLAARLRDIMWLHNWCEHQLALVWMEIGNDLRPWGPGERARECER